MKLVKRIVAIIVIAAILVLSSCLYNVINPYAGMRMDVDRDSAYILGYEGNAEVVYFPQTYMGRPVKYITGIKRSHFIGSSRVARFDGPNLKRVYFAWCTGSYPGTATNSFPDYMPGIGVKIFFTKYDDVLKAKDEVVSLASYNKLHETGKIGAYRLKDYLGDGPQPANIAFFFNYLGAPNENYFFIDLLESDGKLNKPPYNPEREGYIFSGWYKDSDCTIEWDFKNDVVDIRFDENGERIYEEIRLYAKWAPVS